MHEKTNDLSKYRLEKADEDIISSKLLFDNGHFAQSVNRSYYAIFHAARALLIFNNFESKKHSGVISYFNQNYIKTKIFSHDLFKIINNAEKIRIQSDYDDFYIASKQQAEQQIENALEFIKVIKDYISKNYLPTDIKAQ